MPTLGRAGIRDCVDITFFDISTNKPLLFLDSLKMSSTEIGAETVYARGGRGNPRRIGWDSTKDVDVNMQDCLISPEALALHLGSTLTTGQQYVPVTEVLTVSGTTATLASTPYTASTPTYPYTANENTNNDGSTVGTELTIAATPTAGQFKVAGTTITYGTTYSSQKIIVTYYKQSSVQNKRITIDADKFPATFKVTGYCLWRDETTGKDFPCRVTIPKAKLLAPFTISQAVDGDPSVFDMNLTALKPGGSQSIVIYDIETDAPIN